MPFIKNGLSQSLGQVKLATPAPTPTKEVVEAEKMIPIKPEQGK